LGDLGADVIKIEPLSGDPVRGTVDIALTQISGRATCNYISEYANRNKRSITLDLKTEKGRGILYKLVEKSDVFVHNYRPKAMKRLKLDYETLSRYNPQLIYGHGSAWGSKGPDSEQPGMDQATSARAGLMYMAGEPEAAPVHFVTGLSDQAAAIVLAMAILAALFARERRKVGQQVNVSGLGSVICLESLAITYRLLHDEEFPRRSRLKMGNPLWNYYQCADGKWLILAMQQADRYWSSFCKVMGIEHLERNQKFDNMRVRASNSEELISILDQRFSTKPREEWLELLAKADLIAQPIQTISEVVADPQVVANNYIINYEHPVYGLIKMIGFPYEFSRDSPSVRRAAPELGQHTEEILLEMGYTWNDIVDLKNQGIV
jgi:crotonobetainyl-CoA:carnitine CoA-transferase CaiB-like acyl-CoA transferase